MKRHFKQNPTGASGSNFIGENSNSDNNYNEGGPSFKHKKTTSLNPQEIFAKIVCKSSSSGRLKIYRKLASLLRNRFSLMESLDRIYNILSNNGKSPGEPMAYAVAQWTKSLSNGEPLSVAMQGWAPSRELLMISTGDVANLDEALENLIKVTEGGAKLTGPIVEALLYPAFLSLMVVAIIYGIGAYLVPPMIDAAPNIRWTGVAKDLIDVSGFVQENWLAAFSVLPICFFIIWLSFPRWKGYLRAKFDDFPPWSLYRVYVGVGWLLSFSALIKAGTPVSKALTSLTADATPYLLERVNKAMFFVANGDNIGDALYKTNYNFPDPEIIGDLRIYSELDNFQDALSQMAFEWLEQSIKQIQQKAAVLNTAAILAVVSVVGWAVLGTFEMQDQISRAIG